MVSCVCEGVTFVNVIVYSCSPLQSLLQPCFSSTVSEEAR